MKATRRAAALAGALFVAACGGSQPGQPRPPTSTTSNQQNRPPVIQELATSPLYVAPGAVASTRAVASDPDFDSLDYDWTIQGGTIVEGGRGPIVTWQAGEGVDKVVLSLTVKDREAFVEQSEEIVLAKGRLLLETLPPAEAEAGAEYVARIVLEGVDEMRGASLQVLYPAALLDLEEVVVEGLTADRLAGWSALVDEPSKGRLFVLLVGHADEPRGPGALLSLRFSLADDESPGADAVHFGHQGLEVEVFGERGEVIPAAAVDPEAEG